MTSFQGACERQLKFVKDRDNAPTVNTCFVGWLNHYQQTDRFVEIYNGRQ